MVEEQETDEFERIAIVGMAGRFPKAESVDALWNLVKNKELGIRFLTDEELRDEGISEEQIADPDYVKAKGVLENVDLFDADFFSYTPREAEFMDPQQRFFLECCWEAMENAGYAGETRPSNIGVFGGVSFNTYLFNLFSNAGLLETYSFFQAMLVNDRDYLTTRVSYELDLTGPSLNVQTGCSSSLVAVHLACQSLLSFESDMALAGGASITLPSRSGYQYQPGGIASPDGFCRAFDAKAKGTVNGNGVAVVMLKRLSDAVADRDTIYAVIKGSAINNDGLNKIGFTAPSVEGQSKVIVEALSVAGVEPQSIGYIETHGTGTPLGDPIEIRALTKAFGRKTQNKNFCAIGSIKSNIGHLDAAAGVTGLIKAGLSLWHREIPPTLNFEEPNPNLNIDESPFYVNSTLQKWESGDAPRRAAVSSFGIGGTNAHFILEEAPLRQKTAEAKNGFHVLPISAKTSTALKRSAENLAAHLKKYPETDLADAAFSLHAGRKNFDFRRSFVCRDIDGAIGALTAFSENEGDFSEKFRNQPQIVMMFPGQGSQFLGMGAQLYENEKIFRGYVDACAVILQKILDTDIRKVLFGGDDEGEEKAAQRLDQTAYTQPALFVFEYALAKLLIEKYGIEPNGFIGHSLGEYVAACLAQVFSLEDALKLVTERGRLMQAQPSGDMLAVGLPATEIEELLALSGEKRISVAALNAPQMTVIAGEAQAVEKWKNHFDESGCFNQILKTSHAFHSPMMDAILEDFGALLSEIKFDKPQARFISNVTGNWITDEEATDRQYWKRHLRQAVNFSGGIETLSGESDLVLLEVGPGKALSNLAKRQIAGKKIVLISAQDTAHNRESEYEVFLESLGKLWENGVQLSFDELHENEKRGRIPLPAYPFERKRFWIERKPASEYQPKETDDYARQSPENWFYVPTWKKEPVVAPERINFDGKVLLFADESKLSRRIAEQLNNADIEFVKVLHGQNFEQVSSDEYVLSVKAEDFAKLLTELENSGQKPSAVINLWTCDNSNPKDDAFENKLEKIASVIDKGFFSLTYFMQAVGQMALAKGLEEIDGGLRIVAVTKNLYSILGTEEIDSAQALISGICRVIPQEYPNVESRIIDTGDFDEKTIDAAARQIISGAIGAKDIDEVTAFRGKSVWKRTFERAVLPDLIKENRTGFKTGGVYLVTGGLGGIGLEIAAHLTSKYEAKVILLSRTKLPEPENWQQNLSENNLDERQKRKILKLLELKEQNADVLVLNADVSDFRETENAVKKARDIFGEIDGIIHAAGIAGETLIQLATPSSVDSVVSPKVVGLLNLEHIFGKDALDFVMLFSSHRSITGGVGGADYSSANAFLDAFAESHNFKTEKVVSVIWDGWKEVGMAVETAERLNLNPDHVIETGVTNIEGIRSLENALNLPFPAMIVSTVDFEKVIGNSRIRRERNSSPISSEDKQAPATNNRPHLSSDYEEPKTEPEKIIAGIWQNLLGIAPIGVRDNFFELGGDSVLCIQVVAQANKKGLSLSAQHVFQNQTIAELSLALNFTSTLKPEQEIVTGKLPLTPIQHWFFEQKTADPNHFNQSLLFEFNEQVETESLREATRKLIEHHDALRMSFKEENGFRTQFVENADGQIPFESISLAACDEPLAEVVKISAEIQEKLNLEEGKVFRVTHFDLGEKFPARILLTCHHLVVDAISWRFMMEDLLTAYEAIRRQQKILLPAKTFSFKKWAEELEKLAQSDSVKEDARYWLDIADKKIDSITSGFSDKSNRNTIESEVLIQKTLDAETTGYILKQAVPNLRVQIVEVILAGIMFGFAKWNDRRSLLIDIEGHGRDFPIDEIDVSRTAGWFTTIYPVLFDIGSANVGNAVRNIKDQLRAVPNKGNNYGLLRYLRKDRELNEKLASIPKADMSFLYLGKIEKSSDPSETSVSRASEKIGNLINPKSARTHLFAVTAFIQNDRLHVELSYSRNLYEAREMARLLDEIIGSFGEIKNYSERPDDSVISATDFPDADLEAEDLENLLSQINLQNYS